MKEKKIKEIINYIYNQLEKEEKKEFDKMNFAEMFTDYLNKDIKKLGEEESVYLLEKLKSSIEQFDSSDTLDNISQKDIDRLTNMRNYIIQIDDTKKNYSLEELLNECDIKQLNLYNTFYKYIYNIYNVEEISDKKKLIDSLKKEIVFNFKKYISKASNQDIGLFKDALKNNGIVTKVNEDLIPLGFFIPFKSSGRKNKYIMAKELLNIIDGFAFDITTDDTKKVAKDLIGYLIVSKGIVSSQELEIFIMDKCDLNIRKEEVVEIASNNFVKKDDYYYIDKMIDKKLFNELIKIKEENPYVPDFHDIIDFKMMVNELTIFLIGIAEKEVKMDSITKTLFYKPMEVHDLVSKICKKLKINELDEESLEEFLYENIYEFPYWIYNGEKEDISEDTDFLDFDDTVDSDFTITEDDLPF